MTFWRRKGVQSTVLLLPYLIVFIMFVAGPLLQTVISSFSGDAGLFEYYRTAFAMPEFRRALSHTVGYTFLAALLVMLLAFPTAFMIHRVVNRYRRLRYIVAMPYASGMMSLAMIWLMFFNGSTGLVNKLLPLFGLSPQNWLETPVLAFLCVFTLTFWRGFSFTLFNCLRVMETQPQELYEYATLAGAGRMQIFRHIALPHMVPTLNYIVPTAMVSVLTTFEPVLLLNYAGMSTDMTNTLTFMFYKQANLGRPGVASAIAVLLLVPILLCSWCYMRYILRRKAVK